MTDTAKLKKKLWEKLSDGPYLMMGLTSTRDHSEPLTAMLDEDQVDRIYFFVSRDNRLAKGGPAMAQFVSKGQDYFACLAGNVTVDNDRAMIDKLWSRPIESWFPGGKSDPNLALLRFDIDEAELWEADMSLVGKVKMLFGGRIRPGDEGDHAVVQSTVA